MYKFPLLLLLFPTVALGQSANITVNKLVPIVAIQGDTIKIPYSFNATSKTLKPLTIFVHFVQNGQNLLGGNDHLPTLPTTKWLGNIDDTQNFTISSSALGIYQIYIGLYDPANGARYTLKPGTGVTVDGQNRYLIGTLTVNQLITTAPNEIYISPTGDDSNSGSITKPLKTLTQAQTKARTIVNPIIYLRAGTYRLSSPLEFNEKDQNQVWQAYPGEMVYIRGDKESNWVKNDTIWTIDEKVTNLFNNNTRIPKTRYPDNWVKIDTTDSQDSFNSSIGNTFEPDSLKEAIAIVREYEWNESHLPITQFIQPSFKVKPSIYPLASTGQPGVIKLENVPLLKNNTYYTLNNKSYYYNNNSVNLTISNLVTLINIQNSKGLKFYHLCFENTAERTLSIQEGGDYTSHAIRILGNSSDINISECIFSNIGTSCIGILDNSKNVTIDNGFFQDIGESGIVVIGGHQNTNSNHKITKNIINNVGSIYPNNNGILLASCTNCVVENNEISTCSYVGIRLNGQLDQIVPSENNIIQNNKITHCMRKLSDGGAIYTWGQMSGTNYIKNNRIVYVGQESDFFDIPEPYSTIGADVGIYFDDKSDNIDCTGNVILNASWGANFHAAANITFKNNILAYSRMYDINVQPESYGLNENIDIINNTFYESKGKSWFNQWGNWTKNPLRIVDFNTYWAKDHTPLMLKGFDKNSKITDPKIGWAD